MKEVQRIRVRGKWSQDLGLHRQVGVFQARKGVGNIDREEHAVVGDSMALSGTGKHSEVDAVGE